MTESSVLRLDDGREKHALEALEGGYASVRLGHQYCPLERGSDVAGDVLGLGALWKFACLDRCLQAVFDGGGNTVQHLHDPQAERLGLVGCFSACVAVHAPPL